LWPDATARGGFYRFAQSVHQDCGGRIVRRDNLHLTLVFLGDVAREKIPQLEAIAGQQSGAGFDLEFGATGYWRRNRIVWAAPLATPGPLRDLVAALEQALQQAGFAFDRRSYKNEHKNEYAPHLTLIRDARAPATLPPLAFDWPVGDFALVESARGARGAEYRVLARWPLHADRR
jgi:2'-5' RNA ligase